MAVQGIFGKGPNSKMPAVTNLRAARKSLINSILNLLCIIQYSILGSN